MALQLKIIVDEKRNYNVIECSMQAIIVFLGNGRIRQQ